MRLLVVANGIVIHTTGTGRSCNLLSARLEGDAHLKSDSWNFEVVAR